jgi:alkyl hydroperoxide reductase subunit AhpC
VAYEVAAGNAGRSADELFRRVQASRFVAEHSDEVCPAKWQPGYTAVQYYDLKSDDKDALTRNKFVRYLRHDLWK